MIAPDMELAKASGNNIKVVTRPAKLVLWVKSHAVHVKSPRKIHVAFVAQTAPAKYLRKSGCKRVENPLFCLVISNRFPLT